jgi:hypothetical protein
MEIDVVDDEAYIIINVFSSHHALRARRHSPSLRSWRSVNVLSPS